MIQHYFVFDGVDSRDFGILLSGPDTTAAPERDVTFIEVPGRNGALTMDNGRFKDVSLPYRAAIIHDFERRFSALKLALLSRPGYRRLEDSIHPEEFRLAAFSGPIEPSTTPYNRAGEFDLEFQCKPQRFLKSGERELHLTQSGAVLINEGLPSLPLLTVAGKGAGSLAINGTTVAFNTGFTGPVILDCELQDAYYGVENKNSQISAPVFPALSHGRNVVTWTGGVTGVDIIPRWWTL